MNIFIGIFEEPPNEDAMSEAKEYFDGLYVIDDDTLLIHDKILDSPASVKKFFGLDEDSGTEGVIFKLNGSYSGYYDSGLWEWMRQARTHDS